jgi:hypothetical protein
MSKSKKAPYILGVPMRRLRPRRFDTWIWSPRPRAKRHLTVNILPDHVMGGYLVRIWVLEIHEYVAQEAVASVQEGARWADKKLRGLLKALGVVES